MKKIILLIIAFSFFSKVNAQNKTITVSGGILQLALPAAAFGSTLIWNDDNTKPTWQFIKTYCSTLILTEGLKHIVLKPRPDGSDNFSFPSGHTSSAFSSAGFIQRRYGWKYGISAYLLASYVGYTRIQAKKHDGWDVLGGACIGVGTAYLFTKPYTKKNIDVTFEKIDGGYLVGLNYTF